ncbi:MAG: hypothetical protein KF712_04600 [Akkermansiaceae bacterium]|nr:hypothetical protein [Akkermansiaceae bacterium]
MTDTTPPPSAISPDGSLSAGWHSQLGEEFAPHAAQLGTFKNVAGLAKSYLHLRANGPVYPGEQSAPEDIARFHSLAKVPAEATPKAYGISVPEHISDTEKGIYDRIARIAHQHHVSGPGLAAVVGEYQKIQGEIIGGHEEQMAARAREAEDLLISRWGADFEPNKSTARHVISTLAGSAGIDLDDPYLGEMFDNPALALMALEFSRRTGEDPTRTPHGLSELKSPRQRAESIMSGSDPTWGRQYTEGNTEEKQAAYQEVMRLLNLAGR